MARTTKAGMKLAAAGRSQVESAGQAYIRHSESPIGRQSRTKRAARGVPSLTKNAGSGQKSRQSRQSASVDSVLDDDSEATDVEAATKNGAFGQREYDVDKILDCRIRKEYLVKWTGYRVKTWEPESNLEHCPKALADYHKVTNKRE